MRLLAEEVDAMAVVKMMSIWHSLALFEEKAFYFGLTTFLRKLTRCDHQERTRLCFLMFGEVVSLVCVQVRGNTRTDTLYGSSMSESVLVVITTLLIVASRRFACASVRPLVGQSLLVLLLLNTRRQLLLSGNPRLWQAK